MFTGNFSGLVFITRKCVKIARILREKADAEMLDRFPCLLRSNFSQ
jgi:hypothetical protein